MTVDYARSATPGTHRHGGHAALHDHYRRCQAPCRECRAVERFEGVGPAGDVYRREIVRCLARGEYDPEPVSRAALGWWLRVAWDRDLVIAEADKLKAEIEARFPPAPLRAPRLFEPIHTPRPARPAPVDATGDGWRLSLSDRWALAGLAQDDDGTVHITLMPRSTP